MEEEKITIGFHFTNAFGDQFDCSSSEHIIGEFETELEMIFRCFNNFLRQIGYNRKNDYIFTDSLTEDELYEVDCFVSDLRAGPTEEKPAEKDADDDEEIDGQLSLF